MQPQPEPLGGPPARSLEPAPANPAKARPPSRPTLAERLRLIEALQSQALTQPDPLLGNLEMINGDVMKFAYLIFTSLEADLVEAPTTPQAFQKIARKIDLHLKCTRQVDRLAQIQRQLAPPPPDAP